ncbi:hypothetical protein H4R18_003916 [Coemansia javaensis]|uniref:Sugar phosphate transporter domain-containing protein n=1 Tax=Coemansia javaensis TaxID=2761396 RepID=A0A9W8LGK3_9FUNG|nr:hypothetical protein H4R18_003916 [Coemansia javaensis]
MRCGGAASILAYLGISLGLTLHSKMVLQWHRFGFPWLVTAAHSLACVVGMRLLAATGRFAPAELDRRQVRLLWLFSVLYTANIAASNVSLHYVSVPLHQVVRGTVPVFTVAMSVAAGAAGPGGYSWRVYASLVPVVVGVALATYGDYYSFTAAGLLLTLLGTVLAAAKTVATNTILVGTHRLRLSALDLLYRLAPMALVQTLAWAVLTGEAAAACAFVRRLHSAGGGGDDDDDDDDAGLAPLAAALVANGTIAFVLNIASFAASKRTSALAMTVAGNVKIVLTIVLGCIVFDVSLSALAVAGVVATIAGGAVYSLVRLREAKPKPKSAA